MLLRPRQRTFVDRVLQALFDRRNTLAVAPTGAGKSVMLAATADEVLQKINGTAIVLAHRDELVSQNRARMRKYSSKWTTGVFDADTKQVDRQVTFSMVQTLSRNLEAIDAIRPSVLLVDEGHHCPAPSYRAVIDRCKSINPNLMIAGMTATPERGDGKGMREIFDNIADVITIGELVRAGHLVRPRTFVIDVGNQKELLSVKKTATDFDMKAVAEITNRRPLLSKVYEQWKENAGDRVGVFFTPDVATAEHAAEVFAEHGVKVAVISQHTADSERSALPKRIDSGDVQVIFNCATLTEGFDNQLISCVGLLRPSSHKSTYIQMVGRGLRTVDPEIYPGVSKSDCLVLDFGTSTILHGSLEQDVTLGKEKQKSEGMKKVCPECQAHVPLNAFECALCGYTFMVKDDVLASAGNPDLLEDFVLTEIEIFEESPYRWEELWNGIAIVATAFEAWAVCVFYGGEWHAIGGSRTQGLRHLARGEKVLCVAAADDFLREHGDSDSAKKSKRWLKLPATEKQLELLRVDPATSFGLTRYKAACYLTFSFNQRGIRARISEATVRRAA